MVPMNLFSQHFISKTVNRAYIFLFSRHGYGVFFVSLLSPCHIQKIYELITFPFDSFVRIQPSAHVYAFTTQNEIFIRLILFDFVARWWSNRRVIVRAKREVALAMDKYQILRTPFRIAWRIFCSSHTWMDNWFLSVIRLESFDTTYSIWQSNRILFLVCASTGLKMNETRPKAYTSNWVDTHRIQLCHQFSDGQFFFDVIRINFVECAAWKRFISSMAILLPSNPSKKNVKRTFLFAPAIAIANCHAFAQFLAMLHCCDLNS